MLVPRLSNIFYLSRSIKTTNTAITPVDESGQAIKDPLRRKKKDGPELQISKILAINGPLHSKQIYKQYLQQLAQKREKGIECIDYFPSLNKIKLMIHRMKAKGKLKSNGYNRKLRYFEGWIINEKKALKYAHPEIKNEINEIRNKRNQL